MNGVIYCATCTINGKQYVGQTMRKFEVRQHDHMVEAKGNRRNAHFYNAIRFYGWESFTWEILEQNLKSHKAIDEMEIFWISKLDTYNNGYNESLGGGGSSGIIVSVETRKKISEANMGRVFSAESKQKISQSHIGIRPSEKTKQKLRELNTGDNNPTSVLLSSAVADIKVALTSGITATSLAKQYKVKLYIIQDIKLVRTYKNVLPELNLQLLQAVRKPTVILQLDKQTGEVINEYFSQGEASRQTGIQQSNINKVCKGQASTAGGFGWKYKEEIEVA
jgi:group I intron endonuclease